MIKRTLLVSFLSFIIVSVPIYFFGYGRDIVKEHPELIRASLIRYYVFVTIPILAVIFIGLLIYNRLIKRNFFNKTTKQKNRVYLLYSSFIFSLIMVMFLLIFYQDNGKSLSQFLIQHAGYIALLTVTFFLNRKLVWKNFK